MKAYEHRYKTFLKEWGQVAVVESFVEVNQVSQVRIDLTSVV